MTPDELLSTLLEAGDVVGFDLRGNIIFTFTLNPELLDALAEYGSEQEGLEPEEDMGVDDGNELSPCDHAT